MKSIFLCLLAVVAIVACQSEGGETEQPNPEMEKLKAEIEELKIKNGKKDSSFYSMVMTFNEIEDNLKEIKEREGLVTVNTADGTEVTEDIKENMIADIQAINGLLQENKNKIAALRSKLKKANLANSEAQKFIETLTAQIQQKEEQIAGLKQQLASMQISMKLLNMENMEQQEVIESQTKDLNTAWFAYGTQKELKENGIITKEGGFIGLGKTAKLKDDFTKEYFTKIDITKTNEIDLHSKDAKVITSHPSGSYELDRGDKVVHKLVVKDAVKFWSVSKYLVIVVEN